MIPLSNWVLHLYKATADPTATPYSDLLLSTIAGYSGYATTSAYIIAPQNTKEVTATNQEDVSGWMTGRSVIRNVFNVELWLHQYTDSSTLPDLTDWDGLTAFLSGAEYLWIRMVAGSRDYPTDAAKAMPVVLESLTESVNKSSGTHFVTLGFKLKGLA